MAGRRNVALNSLVVKAKRSLVVIRLHSKRWNLGAKPNQKDVSLKAIMLAGILYSVSWE